jgi:Na+-driven multidrug efflux pump
MFVYAVVDATKCIALNVLRSTGRPSITVFVNTVACLCVMLPFGYYWGGVYCGYGLMGLWAGMSLAWLVATIIFTWIVMRTDWSDPSLIVNKHSKNRNNDSAKGQESANDGGVELSAIQ